ncbi:MAG TPA: condensation domain-containing protein, partial [Thermoanaerobaculia bacterium]
RNVARLVLGSDFARFGPDETFLQMAPAAFDASTLEIWGPLLHGGRLALFPDEKPTLESLGRALAEHRVTTLWLTAGLFHQMVELALPSLGGLRQLLAGGDALSPQRVREALAGLPATTLVNGYGPTEGTTFSVCHRMTGGSADAGDVRAGVPIGRPIANARALVLAADGEPVPLGAVGELYVGGEGVARGYLARPELTALRFVPDPSPGRAGERLYRTGDRVRFLPDGRLEFLGRLDQQLKVRGFRVEPGEIETALAALPGIAAAAVVARRVGGAASSETLLTAYLVAADGRTLDTGAVALALRRQLPEPMVPTAWKVLPALPLTENGKVDRRALSDIAADSAPAGRRAPATPAEERLTALWADLLGRPDASPDDGFFELGGHSRLATRALARVRADFAVELPLSALFEDPTPAALARRIEGARRSAEPPLVPTDRTRALPLSFGQERLWLLDRLYPGPLYHVPLVLRLRGPLDAAAWERSVARLRDRHEVLRTRYPSEGGRPEQVVDPAGPWQGARIDLSALPAFRRDGEAERVSVPFFQQPFDLASGPVMRTALQRLAADEHRALVSLHHIATDGWSSGVLAADLLHLYRAEATGEPAGLPALPVQFADFAAWQRERLTDEALAPQLDYWRHQLAGASVLELPADRPRPESEDPRGAALSFRLPSALAEALRATAQAAQATLFMTVLAGFSALLGRLARSREVVLGTVAA